MPRRTRVYIGGMPAPIVQRGNNREACFFAEQDYQFYLECLGESLRRYDVAACVGINDEPCASPDDTGPVSGDEISGQSLCGVYE